MAYSDLVKGKYLQATGAAGLGRTRIKALYVVPGASAGSVSIRDGGASGTEWIKVDTVASATQPTMIIIPGDGVLFQSDPYVTLTNVTSATAFYA